MTHTPHKKMLFEEGDWGMALYNGYPRATLHHKCNTMIDPITVSLTSTLVCSYCYEPAPEGIVALLTLYNWDK